jgi:hypothetical protein
MKLGFRVITDDVRALAALFQALPQLSNEDAYEQNGAFSRFLRGMGGDSDTSVAGRFLQVAGGGVARMHMEVYGKSIGFRGQHAFVLVTARTDTLEWTVDVECWSIEIVHAITTAMREVADERTILRCGDQIIPLENAAQQIAEIAA